MTTGRRRWWGPAWVAVVLLATGGCAPAPLQIGGKAVATRDATTAPLPPEALANIRNLDLRQTILTDERVPAQLREIVATCTRCGLDDPVYLDITADGNADVLVPIYDEMTQAGTVVYSVRNGRPVLLFAHYGHQATVDITPDNYLDLSVRLYAPDEPMCCPSGERTTRYRWDGRAFVQESVRGDDPRLAPADDDDTVVVGP